MESMRPKLDREVGTQQEGSNGVGNHWVTTFDWRILVGSISTSGSNFTSKSSEEFAHFRVVAELTTLVHENTFARVSRGMLLEELSEPVDRRGFRNPCVAMFHLEKWSVTRIQEVSPLRPMQSLS